MSGSNTLHLVPDVDIFREQLLVNVAVLGGLAVVAPMALGGRRRWWWSSALFVAWAFAAPASAWPALWAVPLLIPLADAGRRAVHADAVARLAVVWAAGAVGALTVSLAGHQLLGIGEPIVRLTAVHYLYAGVGALVIAGRLRRLRPGRLADVALAATAAAPPLVAAGFVLHHPLPQVGGAVLMTVGVWSAAIVMGRWAWSRHGPRRIAGLVAASATWVPMVLAVTWAAANYWWGVPALSVPEMARTHGVINAVGFVIAGLVATAPRHATVDAAAGAAEVAVDERRPVAA